MESTEEHVLIEMEEIPIPRMDNMLIWVDDNPEKNLKAYYGMFDEPPGMRRELIQL